MIGAVLDFVRPKPKRKTSTKWDFVPVLFANGRDDDLPGFTAMCKDERFQLDEKIYEPGEAVEIRNRTLLFSCHSIYIVKFGVPIDVDALHRDGWEVIIRVPDTRTIRIDSCTFIMRRPG